MNGKTCLVTGGGGSIGSELVRQLAAHGASVVIADIYENGAYNVKCEIGDAVGVEIASVRDYGRMESIFAAHKPAFVFHAAAHKHVPFMERNPEEAVKNNIRGTDIVSELAAIYGASQFVLISTDKAVEPISVMGASKRVCEMLMHERSRAATATKFSTVRFGNVLNSNGSVIPLFKRQLKLGMLTVTDPNVTRYFMGIPDAAGFILQSLNIARGGDVFIPDMGDSIRILDLAEQVIREAGKEPYKDIKIEFTGLRQGDKLTEKLFFDFEKPERTAVDKLLRADSSGIDGLTDALRELYALADIADRDGIRAKIFEMTNRRH